jgi:hypothetical protein
VLSALLITCLLFVPVIAMVGISELGEFAIGREGTATYAANATLWNTTASLGITPFLIILIVVVGCLMILFIHSVKKSGLANYL